MDVISLDISKALDTISQSILQGKLLTAWMGALFIV